MAGPGRIFLDIVPKVLRGLAFVILEFLFEKVVDMLAHN